MQLKHWLMASMGVESVDILAPRVFFEPHTTIAIKKEPF